MMMAMASLPASSFSPPFVLDQRPCRRRLSVALLRSDVCDRGLCFKAAAGHRPASHSAAGAAPRRRSSQVRAQAGFSELAPTAAALYGTLLLGGGLFAYSSSSSKGSLFGGLTGGALMGLVYALASSPDTKNIGDAIGFGTALLFVAVFGIRLAATKKLVPAAPLLLLSLAATAVFYNAYIESTL